MLRIHGLDRSPRHASSTWCQFLRHQVYISWFGVIRPSQLSRQAVIERGDAPTEKDLSPAVQQRDLLQSPDGEDPVDEAKSKKALRNPLANSAVASWLANLLGFESSPGQGGSGGAGMPIRSIRRVRAVGPHARPLPVALELAHDDQPGAVAGIGGGLYSEWDVHGNSYRAEWCRVIEFPVGPVPDAASGTVEHDEVLRRRLARLGLGPRFLRRRPDGDDIDIDAAIDLAIDLQAVHSATEDIYLEQRKTARNLGILVLLDISGSATETDISSRSVHEHQIRAAATLAVTLEELGDSVAVYGFRSLGRSAVQMFAVKPFDRRFGAGERAQLHRIEPPMVTHALAPAPACR